MCPLRSWTGVLSPSSAIASPRGTTLGPLERAVVWTVAYGDVFEFPLTRREVHRYLIGMAATFGAVHHAIERAVARGYLATLDGHVTLVGRTDLVDRRAHRTARAAALWRRARAYGGLMAHLPFVRFVAVTGALAVDNVEPDADIDYFLVTEPDRLWLARALVIALVRWAGRRGDRLCPNYLVSERALALEDRNLFTAHELTQLVPLAGLPLYGRLRRENAWTETFLPNARGAPRTLAPLRPGRGTLRRVAEHLGRSRVGALVEHWERTRKIRRFTARAAGNDEARFGPDWCKGHFEGHGRRVLEAFVARLGHLDLVP